MDTAVLRRVTVVGALKPYFVAVGSGSLLAVLLVVVVSDGSANPVASALFAISVLVGALVCAAIVDTVLAAKGFARWRYVLFGFALALPVLTLVTAGVTGLAILALLLPVALAVFVRLPHHER